MSTLRGKIMRQEAHIPLQHGLHTQRLQTLHHKAPQLGLTLNQRITHRTARALQIPHIPPSSESRVGNVGPDLLRRAA